MNFNTWSIFALAVTAASISPGPNVLLIIMNTLKHGKRGAALTILGNLSALLFIALIAAIGVGAIIQTHPYAYSIMKWVGGAYLIWVGFKLIKASLSSPTNTATASVPSHKKYTAGVDSKAESMAIYLQAVGVSASNPKVVLFLSAIFPQFLSVNKPIAPQFALLFISIILIVAIIHSGYAWSSLWMRKRPVSQGILRWLSRLTGGFFIGLGLAVAFDKP